MGVKWFIVIIIWQGSPDVNPSVLIESYLGRILSTEAIASCVFLFAKAGKFKINKFGPSAT